MKPIFILFSCLLAPFSLFAQDWTAQTSGTTNYLSSVFFTDPNTGWAVGNDGTIVHTTNGGVTWAAQTSGTTSNLLSVFFTDQSTGWAVGYDGIGKGQHGTSHHTTDGGTTWISTDISGGTYATRVHFVDANRGWIFAWEEFWGASIVRTTDGGITWQYSGISNSVEILDGYFVDAYMGWVVGVEGGIYHTTDGGVTWTTQTSGASYTLSSVFFTDANTGWAVGGVTYAVGTILHTTNGGVTWAAQTSGTTNYLSSVFFTDPNTGWAVGLSGTILHTTNGGASWTAQTSGTGNGVASVFFTDARTGWAVGSGGTILHYYSSDLLSVEITMDPTTVPVLPEGGQVSFEAILTNVYLDTAYASISVDLVQPDGDTVAVVPQKTMHVGPGLILYKDHTLRIRRDDPIGTYTLVISWIYADGGTSSASATFEKVLSLYDNGPLVNNPGGGVGGADESVLQNETLGMTTNGFGHQSDLGNRVADDFTVSDPNGWAIDSLDFFGYQTFSGTTSPITDVYYQIWDGPPNDPGSSVIFGDLLTDRLIRTAWSNIYRVSESTSGVNTDRPIMQNTVDGGVTLAAGTYWLDWTADGTLSSGPWAPPITIGGETITGNALQYVGSSGIWVNANDFGTMTKQGIPFLIHGTRVSGSAPRIAFRSGSRDSHEGGSVTHPFPKDRGSMLVSPLNDEDRSFHIAKSQGSQEDLPQRFDLAQNYPNPFNPVTTVSYELPVNTHVSLIVTDIVGREVARLVDGYQEAGYKTALFDASSLASGIYFYRLQAGGFVETRKLIFVR